MVAIESILKMTKREKTVEIIQCLSEGPRNVSELIRIVGGSASTTVSRVRQLQDLGWVKTVKSEKFPFKGVITLTDRGEKVSSVLGLLADEGRTCATDTRDIQDLPESRERWILALLFAFGKKVRGSTRLEKLLFLLKNSLPALRGGFYEFRPYMFGPFSAEVLEDAKKLKRAGLVKITEELLGPQDESDDYVILRTYFLTPTGEDHAKVIFESLSSREKEAIIGLRAFNDMPLSGLVAYVHEHFKKLD